MRKKLITSVVCLALLMIMFLGSSIAWFTDTAYHSNTMVAGKISIKQEEDFTQDTIIMPNVPITKKVVVTNNGNLPCFVRTLFAFEDSNTVDVLKLINLDDSGLDVYGGSIVIDGITNTNPKIQFTVTRGTEVTTYTVGYYLHNSELEIGGTINPLSSITLDKAAENIWHETVGDKYEVFVLSQASQVAGLSNDAATALKEAFGEINGVECAKWFAYVLRQSNVNATVTVNSTNIVIA